MTVVREEWLRDGQLVAYYLMASFLYYQHDISLFPDTDYDRLCERLRKKWNKIEHPHKRIVDRDALTAGTGYYIRIEEYPLVTQSAAFTLARMCGLLDNTKEKRNGRRKGK